MKIVSDVSYSTYPETLLDIYLPQSVSFPVLVFFHGGGMEMGSRSDERELFEELAQGGVAVVSADYRMYPQAQYPQFIEDAAACVDWTFDHIGQYGGCTGIYVSGSSAGGYLAMMLCYDGRWLGRHGRKAADLAGFVFDAAQPTTHFNVLRERGMDTRRVVCDDAAPLYHAGEAQDLPPMLALVSDHDIPGRLEQTQLLVATLRQFGYGEERLACQVMLGYEHTEYLHVVRDGGNVFAKIVREFIERVQGQTKRDTVG